MFRWLESFTDPWGSAGDFYTRRYRSVDANTEVNAGRFDGNAFRGGASGEHIFSNILAEESPEPETWIVCFDMKILRNGNTGSTHNDRVVGLTFFTNTEGSPIENQITLMVERVDAETYKWQMRRGSQQNDPLIAESDNFAAEIWHRWELKINIDPSTGWFELRRDGVAFFVSPSGGINTAAAGSAGADSIGFYLNSLDKWTDSDISYIYLDNLCVMDDDGTGIGTDFINDNYQIERILPEEDDTVYTEWELSEGVSHNDLVNETSSGSTEDDKYIFSDDPGERDLFRYSELQTIQSDIKAIQINTVAAMKASGQRKFRHIFNDRESTPANLANGDTLFTINSGLWTTKSEIMESDIVNGGDITKTLLDNYSIGVNLIE